MEKKLFAVYLWWKREKWFLEDHDLIFVVAKNKNEAKKIAKWKTNIEEDLHCDWIVQIENVDGYTIKIVDEWKIETLKYDNTYQKI